MDVRRVPGWWGCPASKEGVVGLPSLPGREGTLPIAAEESRSRRAGEGAVRVPRGLLRLARAGYSE